MSQHLPLPGLANPTDFQFAPLRITGINNEPVLAANSPAQREEETCLFHQSIATGDAYVQRLTDRLAAAIREHKPLPVIRFADGEYEFYRQSLKCNGLYQQAESVAAIRTALPRHATALREVAATGVLAPLLFPGNMRRRSWFRKTTGNDLAWRFLDWVARQDVALTGENYIPFYAVYACLSAPSFAAFLDGKTVAVVNSHFNGAACAEWFAAAGAQPRLVHVPLPESYVATRWETMRNAVFTAVPAKTDCFLVGAGIGALLVCADLARQFAAPAIDAGHIVNVMNDLERKSKGPRLFTHRR
jgi:hypothetical protein